VIRGWDGEGIFYFCSRFLKEYYIAYIRRYKLLTIIAIYFLLHFVAARAGGVQVGSPSC
jgi:hypothetical protein